MEGFSIGQVSKMSKVPEATLRYWEKAYSEFLSPARTNGEHRRYSSNELAVVFKIKVYTEIGYNSKGIRRKLKENLPK